MADRFLFNTRGDYVAFVDDNNIFDTSLNWIGFIEDGDDVFSAEDGSYMGTLLGDDRLVVGLRSHHMRRMRPLRPVRPLRPLRPLRRLRMANLPPGLKDYFEVNKPDRPAPNSASFFETLTSLVKAGALSADNAASVMAQLPSVGGGSNLTPASIMDSELRTLGGKFLGRVNRNRYDQDSLVNTFGPYGSRYSGDSIFNKYSTYGSPYGAESPYNEYSQSPPVFVKNGRSLGYLTVNNYLQPRVDPQEFLNWLETGESF